MQLHQLDKTVIKDFVTAGNALVTLENIRTGTRYTYKIKRASDAELWFISLLVGTNNDSDYQFICYFRDDLLIRLSKKSRLPYDAAPVKAIDYLIGRLDTPFKLSEQLGVYHSCKCGRCGRTLTTPDSIKNGIGPECIKRI